MNADAADRASDRGALNVERSFARSRIPAPRQDASERELARVLELLVAEERRNDPDADDARIRRKAQDALARMRKRDRRLLAAIRRLAPSSTAPDRNHIYASAEIAAAVALPPMSRLLSQLALSPALRGPISDLSGAVACLCQMATAGGASIALSCFDQLSSGSVATRWAFNHPNLATSRSQRYRTIKTVTGGAERAGHDPDLLLEVNLELIRDLRELPGTRGPLHARVGEVGVVDVVRLYAPVQQHGPVSAEHLETLRRRGMEMVNRSTYEHNGQFDTVIGWKGAAITDQASSLPLVWAIGAGNAYEPDLLFGSLLPTLFRLWRECPLHTLIGDGLYDKEPVCRALVDEWSIQPIFKRYTRIGKTRPLRGGAQIEVINGVPECPRCGAMNFVRREGWYTAAHRLAERMPRGRVVADVKNARTRWRCKCGLHEDVSLWAKDDPRDHTYWPRDGHSNPGVQRRALELSRNGVESNFAHLKHHGVGPRDGRALWAGDADITILFGLEQLIHTAKRVAHEDDSYPFFHDEYRQLGLHLSGQAPTPERMRELEERRPPHLRWRWPTPGRTARGSAQNAA